MPNRRGRKQKEELVAASIGTNPPQQKAPAPKKADNKESEEAFDRATLFTKTKMCKFHLLGICAKGSSCMYAHNATDLHDLPDLFRTKLCKSLISTGACNDPHCKYAHNKDELRSTSELRKTKMCKFWLEGRCELGKCCSYAHSPLELNQPASALPAENQDVQSVQVGAGFAREMFPQVTSKSPSSGGYAVTVPMALNNGQMPQLQQLARDDSPREEESRQVMVIDAKTGKPLVAGTMKSGGSIQLNAGRPSGPGWFDSRAPCQQELYGPDYGTSAGPLLGHQLQQEMDDAVRSPDPMKIGLTTSNFWQTDGLGKQSFSGLGLSSPPLRKVRDNHRVQPGALGQPKTSPRGFDFPGGNLADSPLRGSPLLSPETRPPSTPEKFGANSVRGIWGSDSMFSSQPPVHLEQVSGGDWVVRNTFVDFEDEPQKYPMRPVASCMGSFESMAKLGSLSGSFGDLKELGS